MCVYKRPYRFQYIEFFRHHWIYLIPHTNGPTGGGTITTNRARSKRAMKEVKTEIANERQCLWRWVLSLGSSLSCAALSRCGVPSWLNHLIDPIHDLNICRCYTTYRVAISGNLRRQPFVRGLNEQTRIWYQDKRPCIPGAWPIGLKTVVPFILHLELDDMVAGWEDSLGGVCGEGYHV